MLPWKKLSIVPLILYIRFYTSTCVPRYHMTLRERRRGFDPRLTSGRLGSSTVSGAAGSSSTCRFGAPFVRRYISRRRVEATADPRHTVALSPPRVALRHFRTSCEKPPRTYERWRSRVAIFRHGCTHPAAVSVDVIAVAVAGRRRQS